MKTVHKKFKGFTLIELLVVVTIIATLAVTVFVALNPGQRLKDAKDARRTADVDSILTAIHEAIVDNKGSGPSNLTTAEKQLGTSTGDCTITTGGCNAGTACADIHGAGTINVAKYLKSMPISPDSGTTTYSEGNTGYTAFQDSNGLVTVRACGYEGAIEIFSSR